MTKYPITPLSDRVLIEKEDAMSITNSGIVLPESVMDERSTTMKGTIVAVGDGRKTDEGKTVTMSVAVGQKVIFSWGDKVEIENKEYYLVTEASILGIIE